ncbi:hypothetical protein VNO77_16589 [Canavalia gladiata]|uniref:Uncharacterized protein n=1 Tax=Canavalia gladiata TaxID=3824 RepID=A0AAN9LHE2_CANGL
MKSTNPERKPKTNFSGVATTSDVHDLHNNGASATEPADNKTELEREKMTTDGDGASSVAMRRRIPSNMADGDRVWLSEDGDSAEMEVRV